MKFQKRVKARAKPLSGRVAVVAGATRGVGRGIALMLGPPTYRGSAERSA
jgi:hypothetical protein